MSYPYPPNLADAIIVFPTWLTYRLIRSRLPEDHHYRKLEKTIGVPTIPLSAWAFASTPKNYQYGFCLWLNLIMVTFAVWVLVWGMRR